MRDARRILVICGRAVEPIQKSKGTLKEPDVKEVVQTQNNSTAYVTTSISLGPRSVGDYLLSLEGNWSFGGRSSDPLLHYIFRERWKRPSAVRHKAKRTSGGST